MALESNGLVHQIHMGLSNIRSVMSFGAFATLPRSFHQTVNSGPITSRHGMPHLEGLPSPRHFEMHSGTNRPVSQDAMGSSLLPSGVFHARSRQKCSHESVLKILDPPYILYYTKLASQFCIRTSLHVPQTMTYELPQSFHRPAAQLPRAICCLLSHEHPKTSDGT